MPNINLKRISEEVSKSWPLEKYKATCETIVDLELSIAFLTSKEGRKIADEMSGSNKVDEELSNKRLAISIRKTEKEFLEKLIK